MTRAVIVSPEAEAQIAAIDAWWRGNRLAAPDLFAEELAEAFSTIELAPEAGQRYPHPDVKGVRRILLRATRHHVYYLSAGAEVVILAVWGSVKGAGPDLTKIGT
jgi:plasmid stabilization system protein ParE